MEKTSVLLETVMSDESEGAIPFEHPMGTAFCNLIFQTAGKVSRKHEAYPAAERILQALEGLGKKEYAVITLDPEDLREVFSATGGTFNRVIGPPEKIMNLLSEI